MTKVVKVRELPGPAGSSKENDRTLPRKNNQSSRTDDMDCFLSANWQYLLRSLNLTESSAPIGASIRDITTGKHDLRVPRLAAIIDDVSHSPTGCWILRLKDATGLISSFISSEIAAQYPDLTTKGAAVLLQKIGIFVSKERDLSSLMDGTSSSNLYKLYLNIHSRCVVAVFSNQSSLNSKKEDVKSVKDSSSKSYVLDDCEDVEYTYSTGDVGSCSDQAAYQKNYRESFENVKMFSEEEQPGNEKKKVRRSVD